MSLASMHGLAYDVGASMKSVPRTVKAPPLRVYEDALGGSFKATPYPQRIVRPSVASMGAPMRGIGPRRPPMNASEIILQRLRDR